MTYGCSDGDGLDTGSMWDLGKDGLNGKLDALSDIWGGGVLGRCEDLTL